MMFELDIPLLLLDTTLFLLGVATIPVYTRIRDWYRHRQWLIEDKKLKEKYWIKRNAEIQKDLDTWLNWLPYGLEEGDAETIIDQILWSDERSLLYEMVCALRDVLMDDLKDVLQVVEFNTKGKQLTFAIRTDYLPYEERSRITNAIRDEAEESAQITHGEMGLASMGNIIFAIIGEFEHD